MQSCFGFALQIIVSLQHELQLFCASVSSRISSTCQPENTLCSFVYNRQFYKHTRLIFAQNLRTMPASAQHEKII